MDCRDTLNWLKEKKNWPGFEVNKSIFAKERKWKESISYFLFCYIAYYLLQPV